MRVGVLRDQLLMNGRQILYKELEVVWPSVHDICEVHHSLQEQQDGLQPPLPQGFTVFQHCSDCM